jgi:hypothetical protein
LTSLPRRVSYLLSRAQAYTRLAAQALAADYYKGLPKNPDFDPLDPTLIRTWADAIIYPISDPRFSSPRANLLEDFSRQPAQQWQVLPVTHEAALIWIDAAGYRLATSPLPADWQPEFFDRFDFFLDPSKSVVLSKPYL